MSTSRYEGAVGEGFALENWDGYKAVLATPWGFKVGLSDLGMNMVSACCTYLTERNDEDLLACAICARPLPCPPDAPQYFDDHNAQSSFEALLRDQFGVLGATMETYRVMEFLPLVLEELRRNNRAAVDRIINRLGQQT